MLITATTSVHLPKPVSTIVTIKSDSVLTNPIGKHWCYNTRAIDLEMDRSVSEEKSSFKKLGWWSFSSKLDWGSYIILHYPQLKMPPRKLEHWFVLWSFFLLRLLHITLNLPYTLVWNAVVISGLIFGIVKQTTKTDKEDCWSFTCCLS